MGGLFQKDNHKYIKVEYSKQKNPWCKYHPGKIYILNRNSDSKENELGIFEPSSRRKEKKRDLEEPDRFLMYKMEKDDDDEFTCTKWTDNNDELYEIYKFRSPDKIQSILQGLFDDQYIYGVEICPEYKSKREKSDKKEKIARKSDASELYYTAVIFSSYLLF